MGHVIHGECIGGVSAAAAGKKEARCDDERKVLHLVCSAYASS